MQVYNINSGHNAEMLEKSRTLCSYSAFVSKVREYERTLPFEEAMKEAVKYCMDNDILKTFLETHSSEVFNMLLAEWDTEEAKLVWREEGIGIGRAEGKFETARNMKLLGIPTDLIIKATGLSPEQLAMNN